MADPTVPGFGDLLSLLGGVNPVSGIGKQIDQFKRLSNELVAAVENINRTMETLNGTAQRINGFLDDVEPPVRALMPQVTRSLQAMDAVIEQLSGPIEMVAPGLTRLANTLSSPVISNLPTELGGFLDTLGDVAKRLQPLTQMAESAGSLFGLRPLASLRAGTGRQQPLTPAAPPKVETKQPGSKPTEKKKAVTAPSVDKAPSAGKKTAATSKKAAPKR